MSCRWGNMYIYYGLGPANEYMEMALIAWIQSLDWCTDFFSPLPLQVVIADPDSSASCSDYLVFLSQITGIMNESQKQPRPMRVRRWGTFEFTCVLPLLQSKIYTMLNSLPIQFLSCPAAVSEPYCGTVLPPPRARRRGVSQLFAEVVKSEDERIDEDKKRNTAALDW